MANKKKRVPLTREQLLERERQKSRIQSGKVISLKNPSTQEVEEFFGLNRTQAPLSDKGAETSPQPAKPREPVLKKKIASSLGKQLIAREALPAEQGALLLSVADLCALLDISRRTLIRMEQANPIPGRIKLGGLVRYHRETIEVWLRDLVKQQAVSSRRLS